jgi:hypothetical protein
VVGLGLRPGVIELLGGLASGGQGTGEVARHDLEPSDVEPELREPPPLITSEGLVSPLDLLDQRPLVLVAV